MFLRSKQNKVFNAVILRVFVFMMNVLARKSAHDNAVFILPFTWFGSLYKHVVKAIACFMKSFTPHWTAYPNCLQRLSFLFQNNWIEAFSRAIRTAGCVVIRIAVSPLFTHNGCAAKGARF